MSRTGLRIPLREHAVPDRYRPKNKSSLHYSLPSMRFCLVTSFYPPLHFGGDALFVLHLATGLAERGHEVEVVHCADAYNALAGPEPSTPASPPHHPNVKVHTLRSGLGPLSPLWTQQTGGPGPKARALRKILQRDFDVIHFHNVSLIGGPRVLGYGDAIKLYTLHEYWLLCPAHLMFRMNREPCYEPKGCARCMIAHRRPPQVWRYTGLLSRYVKHVDTFFSPSRYGLEFHRRSGFAGPMKHLPNFIPAPEPDSALPVPRESDSFLYVGRLENIKGVDRLLTFFLRWTGGRLRIAGTGSERAALEARAAGCDRIEFLGQLDRPALTREFQRANALIVPSRGAEQFPLVILEALLQKTPVIGHDAGPIREIIEESRGGWVYRNDEELQKILEALVESPGSAREAGEHGRQVSTSKWSEESYFERYFAAIDELTDPRGPVR